MEFDLNKSLEILERTPNVLFSLLQDLSDEWINNKEGADSWSPFDVVGHLIHGENTDWIPRAMIIISEGNDKRFESFDRFAQFENSKGMSMQELLIEFARLRKANIEKLKELNIDEDELELVGEHPELGLVTLSELLSTWVAHDLNHIHQICRVMARNYRDEVGPWQAYISVLKN